jgi:hypothetical protein
MDARIPDSTSGARSLLLRRSLMALLVGGLALLCLLVLRPFLAPMAWATILAYATWPLYCRFRAPFRKLTTAAAAAMTLLVISVGIVPFFALLVLMQHELGDAYAAAALPHQQRDAGTVSAGHVRRSGRSDRIRAGGPLHRPGHSSGCQRDLARMGYRTELDETVRKPHCTREACERRQIKRHRLA